MKKHRLKKKILESIQEMPIVEIMCKKLGVSRNTYYRWLKEDPVFKEEAKEALSQGEERIHDMAESVLFEGVRNKDMDCVKFWLTRRNEKYKTNYFKQDTHSNAVVYDRTKRDEMVRKWFWNGGNVK